MYKNHPIIPCTYLYVWAFTKCGTGADIDEKNLDKFIRAAFHQNRHITRRSGIQYYIKSYKETSNDINCDKEVILIGWKLNNA